MEKLIVSAGNVSKPAAENNWRALAGTGLQLHELWMTWLLSGKAALCRALLGCQPRPPKGLCGILMVSEDAGRCGEDKVTTPTEAQELRHKVSIFKIMVEIKRFSKGESSS